MAGSVNKVILVGNLGQGPGGAQHPGRAEDREAHAGHQRELERQARPASARSGPSGTAWSSSTSGWATIAERYLRKGRKVYVEGAMQTRKWTDQSGAEKYTTEVVLGASAAS